MKNFFLLLVLAFLVLWWFRREDSSTGSSPVRSRTAINATTAPATMAVNPQTVTAQQNQESERQRRKALAEEYARLRAQSEAKEAAYKEAMAAYETKRAALSEQIEALNRTNKNGAHQPAIDRLTEQRLRIPLPQRP